MLAVRRSNHEVVLFLPFSHAKMDLVSSELLKKEIKNSYTLLANGRKEIETRARSYEAFVNQTRSGPHKISDTVLSNTYQLSRITELSQFVNNKISEFSNEPSFMEFEFDIDPQWNSQHLLGQIMSLSTNKLATLLGHHGRTYMDNSYYDCIGECLDIIPFLIHPDDADEKIVRQIHRLIDQKKTHNISFQELLYKAEAHTDFLQTSGYLKKIFANNMFIFNYVGEATSEESDYQKALIRHMKFTPYKRILIEAYHSGNKIVVKYVLPFKVEHKKSDITLRDN
jgi:fengycin family lipopeptide synthetase E